MSTHPSHGHIIEVQPRSFGALAWLGIGLEVRVGGRRFHPKLDGLGILTYTDFDFGTEGGRISGCVRSTSPVWFRRMSYSVEIEGKEVAHAGEVVARWCLCYLAAFFLSTLLALALVGASALVYLAINWLG